MKILMVISQFHPFIGGAEKQAQLLAKKLFKKGIHVNIITGWWDFKTPRKEFIEEIRIFRNFCCWGMFGIKGNRTTRMLGGLIYMISLGVYLIIHRREYDIIHVHQALYPAFVSVLIGKQVLRKPVIVKSASSGMTSDIKWLRQFPLGSFQLAYLLRRMDCLVAVSKITGGEFKEVGYPDSRIVYISNGVEIPVTGKARNKQIIHVISIARLSKEKGVDVLLKAWALVMQEEKALKLTILGDGPLQSEMKGMSQSLGTDEWVKFTGNVHNVEEYLRHADLFVLTSRTEGMSNALLEAMSYGIPCIATKVGGNGELLGGEDKEIPIGGYVIGRNGLLVNPDDVQGLSEAILYFIRNQSEREEMGRRSQKFILENYSIDLVADRYLALYQSMLNKRF